MQAEVVLEARTPVLPGATLSVTLNVDVNGAPDQLWYGTNVVQGST